MPNLNTSYVKVKQWQQIYNKLKMLDLNTSYVEVKQNRVYEMPED